MSDHDVIFRSADRSKSVDNLRKPFSQAKVFSTTHRLASTTHAEVIRFEISTVL